MIGRENMRKQMGGPRVASELSLGEYGGFSRQRTRQPRGFDPLQSHCARAGHVVRVGLGEGAKVNLNWR